MAGNAIHKQPQESGVAIIGMAGRFPGARSLDEFWRNIRNGRLCLKTFTDAELTSVGVSDAELRNPNYVKVGAYLEDIDLFDAEFFDFSPREAQITSPQQRILLECAYHALEDAGVSPDKYHGNVGVFTGVGVSSYFFQNLMSHPEIARELGRKMLQFGNDLTFSATQVSYKLNLTGPSINVATACSTSMVAIHLACRSLLNYECDIALAGASQISVNHDQGYLYQQGGILSRDGRCRAFSTQATGTVSGNGAGIIVLKRLEDAIEDRDHISAVIRGSAINNDGDDKVGYSAPSVSGQVRVIVEAQAAAAVEPADITYVETHGTATPLGDPIEVAALTQAFSLKTAARQYCGIGSLKSNLGHMGTAAGIGSVIKTVLALKHRQIPPSINVIEPNPQLNLETTPFYLNTTLRAWPPTERGRIAGISGFGMGGTNAHLVLQEWPESYEERAPSSRYEIITLSARTPSALEQMCRDLLEYVADVRFDLCDIAYTLALGRREFDFRAAHVATDKRDLAEQLRRALGAGDGFSCAEGASRVVFMFPGQGSQHANMAAALYANLPFFRERIEQCAAVLARFDVNLHDLIYGDDVARLAAGLERTQHAQVALFSVEYATACQWMEWGVQPAAMIGHSLGEYVAACIAGVMSLEDALALVLVRGKLMEDTAPGCMLSVELSSSEIEPYLSEKLCVAAVNAPRLVVVSGDPESIHDLELALAGRKISCKIVNARNGFHSPLMDPVLAQLAERMAQIRLQPPRIPFVSNVTGEWIGEDEACDAEYWARHARRAVQFWPGIKTIATGGNFIYLDIGPGVVTSSLLGMCAADSLFAHRPVWFRSSPSLREDVDGHENFLSTAAALWAAGVPIDWQKYYQGRQLRKVPAPLYRFQRERYWIEENKDPGKLAAYYPDSLQERPPGEWIYAPLWRQVLPPAASTVRSVRGATVLLVGGSQEYIVALSRSLQDLGARVTLALTGDEYRKVGKGSYQVPSDGSDGYEPMLQDLAADEGLPDYVLHVCALYPNGAMDGDSIGERFSSDFHSLWALQRAIARMQIREIRKTRLVCVGTGRANISGNEPLDPVRFSVALLCRVIDQEFENTSCCYVDIDPDPNRQASPAQLKTLITEIFSPSSETLVAIRGPQRYVEYFHAEKLESQREPVTFRERGVYLITGGLGGIGMQVARFLAEHYQARLVLLGRAPAVRQEGGNLVAIDESDQAAALLAELRRLQALGSELLIRAVDVASSNELAACATSIERAFGTINGVIHAAGVTGGGFIQKKTKEEIDAVLAPKVRGALNLLDYFRNKQLDFMFLCSSQNAIKGGVARADYGAANAFLDGLAASEGTRAPFRLQSINWCAWRDTGMAHRSRSAQVDAVDQRSSDSISNAQGVELFSMLVAAACSRAIVSKRDFSTVIAEQPSSRDLLKKPVREPTAAQRRRGHLSSAFVAPRSELEAAIAEIWSCLLGVRPIGVHDQYYELGGNSLLLAQMVLQLSQRFEVSISLQQVLEAQTVASQAEAVLAVKAKSVDVEELERILAEYDGTQAQMTG